MKINWIPSALIILLAVAGGIQPTPGRAFDAAVLDSVVSVLPDWNGMRNGNGNGNGNGNAAPQGDPEGTAVAIFPGGYLATNAHVLGRARKVDIRLGDGRLMEAEIIGRDGPTDLALLKAPIEFPVLTPAAEPTLGQPVCAVGNQFGLGLSVTCGVVSAIRRTGTGFNPIEDFIQTDAVINPGGSGGALVDGAGQLVGLVSAIFTKESDSNIGVNFATSAALVRRVLEDLRDFGEVRRVRSGVRVRTLSREQRRRYSGALVVSVVADTPAEKAGLEEGDILTWVGERRIAKPSDVPVAFQFSRKGETVEVRFLRDERPVKTRLFF